MQAQSPELSEPVGEHFSDADLIQKLLSLEPCVESALHFVEIDVAAYLVAGGLLALSIATDLAQRRIPLDYETTQMFEEGFKFTGAAVWLYFCTRVAAYQAGGEDSAVQRNPSQQQLL